MHEPRPRFSVRARMIMTGLIAVALFFVLYLFFNLTAAGQSLENGWAWKYEVFDTVGYWLRQNDLPPLSYDRATIVVGTLLAVVIAAARRHGRTALWVVVATPGAVLGSEGFKSVFGRPLLVDSRDDAVSYPSGHAVVVLAVAAALLIVVPRAWKRWVAPVLGVWMALATSAIIVIGNHRPSEIIGAALLTIAVFTLTGSVVHLRSPRQPPPSRTRRPAPTSERADPARRAWLLTGMVAVITVAGIVAAWGALPWVTAIDGVTGAAASLLILRVILVVRSWVADLQQAEPGDDDQRISGMTTASTGS
ncbi:phosphatase PAP2 family protein [Microbacterium arborescens]|uniref:phosphatase PAP2 family protein n=1 Tax=Microbacterium arborescens TaxID=33883 RepID=UPI0025A0DDEE|nr:phosphatase PAP2 family protein [Microbacterium arborescens]WJM16936.1 phosphatase PAP2 family protein [Microbacterium arborescens]